MGKKYLWLIALLLFGFIVAGCSEGDDSTTVVNPNPEVFVPTGSISGVVTDICTEMPVDDAVVSVAYSGSTKSVTTSENGAFSFNNVPANGFEGEGDEYYVVCDLTDLDAYGYALVEEVGLSYSDLSDGENDDLEEGVEEGGSGADTPVNKLAATVEFEVGPPSGTITGTIYDVTNDEEATSANVWLYNSGGYLVDTTTSDATTGAYSFPSDSFALAGLIPGSYKIFVAKTGYDYADYQSAILGAEEACGLLPINCSLSCGGETLLGVNVNIWEVPSCELTAPYLTSVLANSTDVIDGDGITAELSTITLNFSEAMNTSFRSYEALSIATSFTVTMTSTGTEETYDATVAGQALFTGGSIFESEDVAWNEAGTALTITLPSITLTTDDLVGLGGITYPTGYTNPTPWGADDVEITAYDGTYTLTIAAENAYLVDLCYVPWDYDDTDDDWSLSENAWYQNDYILDDNTIDIDAEFEPAE